MTRRGATTLALLVALFSAACIPAARADDPPADPYEPWARVLAKFVNTRGEVDFHALARERTDLDAFLAYVARVSPNTNPASFASRDAKLAYYINAYNAIAMFNVIDAGFPRRLSGFTKLKFFAFKLFAVGGERISLYTFENDVIRPLGDERVHFALNCMAAGCPRLPQVPFRAGDLDHQLDAETRRFFGEQRNLQMEPERKLVRVSSLLEFYTDDFLARAPTLIAYINRYAGTPVPDGYDVEFIDYDWTVNDQRRESAGSAPDA